MVSLKKFLLIRGYIVLTLLRFLLGSITIELSGSIEHFLNELYKNEIKVWDLHKTECGKLQITIYAFSFKKINKVCDKTKVKMMVLKTNGALFWVKRYRKRYGIAIGVVLFVLTIWLSSLFVWRIEVEGCKTVTSYDVVTRLKQNGLYEGVLKNKIEVAKIENEFLKNYDSVSWISINIKGTTAYVEIREIDEQPDLVNNSEPCNIYAIRDGIIVSIDDYMGYSVVNVGDAVTAGDLLVSGNYTDKYGVEYKLHSYAKVMAQTVHSHSVSVPFVTTEHIKTGTEINRYSLKLTRFIIPLYFNKKIIYNNYDITKSEKLLNFGNGFVLPIGITKTTYTEVEKCNVRKSKEAALYDAYEKLYDYENNLTNIAVKSKKYEEIENDECVTVTAIYECYEDIGISRKID